MRLATLVNDWGDEQLCYFHQNHYLPVEEVGAVFGTFFPRDLAGLLGTEGEFEDMLEWWDAEADIRLSRCPECSIYMDHAKPDPVVTDPGKIFDQNQVRPKSSVITHNQPIVLPEDAGTVVGGARMGVIIRKAIKGFNATEQDWKSVLAGLIPVITATAVDAGNLGGAFDTFTSIGPFLITPDEFADNEGIAMKVIEALSRLSRHMTLHPGDILLLDEPAIKALEPGVVLECQFKDLPPLVNPVVAEG